MSSKKQYKHKFNETEQAAYNIQTGRGWACPNCGSFVRAGEFQCYACGVEPELDAMRMQNQSGRTSGYDFHTSSNPLPFSLFWTSAMFIIPILYGLNGYLEYSMSNILFIPILYVLIRCIIDLLKEIEDLLNGQKMKWKTLNRLWIFYFSINAIIPIVKTIFLDFLSI